MYCPPSSSPCVRTVQLSRITVVAIWEALFSRIRRRKLTAHLPEALDPVGVSVVTLTVDPRGCFSVPGSASPRFEQTKTNAVGYKYSHQTYRRRQLTGSMRSAISLLTIYKRWPLYLSWRRLHRRFFTRVSRYSMTAYAPLPQLPSP